MSSGGQDRAKGRRRAKEAPVGDPVTAQRSLVEIRAGIADVASRAAEADLARVFSALERYSAQAELLARAESTWNPASVRVAKDAAHHSFRVKVAAARDHATVEAAAAAWLDEINRINAGTRAAQGHIRHEQEVAAALLADIDRLCIEAGASRARADAAVASSREAQVELARTLGRPVEDVAATVPTPAPLPPIPVVEVVTAAGRPGATPPAAAASPAASSTAGEPAANPAATGAAAAPAAGPHRPSGDHVDLGGTPRQALLALLAGGHEALDRVAIRLSAGDAEGPLVWQTWLQGLVDACAAVAVDEGCLDFPREHPFWGLFTAEEARAIARAIAALGFRHDGRGGFREERIPAAHDLVAAVGAAGLVTVRVRHWPAGAELAELFSGVRVASDLLVAERAPNLMLGEVVSLLGWRAEPLTGLWNEWARVRPLLLAPEPGDEDELIG